MGVNFNVAPVVDWVRHSEQEKNKQEVRFCRIEGEEVFFYFIESKGN